MSTTTQHNKTGIQTNAPGLGIPRPSSTRRLCQPPVTRLLAPEARSHAVGYGEHFLVIVPSAKTHRGELLPSMCVCVCVVVVCACVHGSVYLHPVVASEPKHALHPLWEARSFWDSSHGQHGGHLFRHDLLAAFLKAVSGEGDVFVVPN